MLKRLLMFAFTSLLTTTAAQAEDAASLLAKYKSATGGAAWDSAKTLHMQGTLSTGGLSGNVALVQDLLTGRSADSYKLGSVEGADGYDGKLAWERDPGGEVSAQDTPEAVRRTRTQAWLDAHAYWYPQRIKATYGAIGERDLEGKHYRVIEAHPEGGDPVTLWFDPADGLLARVVQRQGADTATTVLDDYRDAGGVRIPFHSTVDLTDAAGRTDPRRRSEIKLDHATLNGAIADADFAMPKMAATAHIDNANGVTRIPFELINNHIYASGSIDGKPARFLVDTGGVNVLTPVAAKKFGIVGEGKMAAGGVGDQRVDLALAHAKEVRVGDAALDRPVFYIIDLGKLADVEGTDADGLVGYEMFRRFGVTIDYAGHTLTLADPAKFTPPANSSAVPFELNDRIPIIAGTLDGVPVRISVDTGSRASLTMHSPFVREHDLVARYHAASEAVVGWGVGGPSRGRPARYGTLRLGDSDSDITGIAGDLYTGDKGSFANPDLAGNLGGGVLHRFTVAFDYANKKMYLAPNADFGKPDAFDRSGLFLFGDGDALLVADVAPESAAARAGVRVQDRVTAIDGKKVGTSVLVEWRTKLRELPVGTRVQIEARRDGKSERFELVLADRIPAAP
ncbi:MAG TPA: aspartyl protease family protein [Rhodanobacteraceae bacterium]|nr:aspartyl protease family protein [Rhodanobacteraceae bacterium]